jgi:hypothetical protein
MTLKLKTFVPVKVRKMNLGKKRNKEHSDFYRSPSIVNAIESIIYDGVDV